MCFRAILKWYLHFYITSHFIFLVGEKNATQIVKTATGREESSSAAK